MTNDALIIENVVKRHGPRQTLKSISLTVQPGERIALLGHNGAGKTTLMKLILGLSGLSSGRIEVFGARPGDREVRQMTAYLPEQVAFHRALSGREQLGMFARLAGEPVATVAPLLERVGLAEAADRRIGGWSKGMRQRLGLAQALIGRPRLALLDEPTSGLDPVSRYELYALIDELARQGCTLLISSHALTEVEVRTDRIAILRDGALVADDSLAALRARAQMPTRLQVTVPAGEADALALRLGGRAIDGCSVEILCAPKEKMGVIARISALGALVNDIEVSPPSLEDLYRHYSVEAQP